MKWTKASEREPEATNGYAKDIVYKQHRDSGTRLMVCTVNQFLDIIKYRVKEKFEWLDESGIDENEKLKKCLETARGKDIAQELLIKELKNQLQQGIDRERELEKEVEYLKNFIKEMQDDFNKEIGKYQH